MHQPHTVLSPPPRHSRVTHSGINHTVRSGLKTLPLSNILLLSEKVMITAFILCSFSAKRMKLTRGRAVSLYISCVGLEKILLTSGAAGLRSVHNQIFFYNES